jgi:hypothetical protein
MSPSACPKARGRLFSTMAVMLANALSADWAEVLLRMAVFVTSAVRST